MTSKETTAFSQYVQMNAELLQTALKSWASFYQSLMPVQVKAASKKAAGECCEIPETDCPPRCACTIEWEVSAGERRTAAIRIRNTSKEPITYRLAAKPFESCGKTLDLSPSVSPASITAAAGETVHATVAMEIGEQFQPGSTWHSEVLVSGKYERCVKVEVRMRCDEDQPCAFDLGEIPYRKRADEWYKHFQCSEPCFEPVKESEPTRQG